MLVFEFIEEIILFIMFSGSFFFQIRYESMKNTSNLKVQVIRSICGHE